MLIELTRALRSVAPHSAELKSAPTSGISSLVWKSRWIWRNGSSGTSVFPPAPAAEPAPESDNASAAAVQKKSRRLGLFGSIGDPHGRSPHDLTILLLAPHIVVAGLAGSGGGV